MSWETLLLVNFKFKSDVPYETRLQELTALKNTLELSPFSQWEAYREIIEDDEVDIIHVNWMSHVDEEKLDEALARIKPYVENFSASLYYLNESDYEVYYDASEEEAEEEVLA